MSRFATALFGATLLAVLAGNTRADDSQANAVLDKAIKALGGEDKLTKADAISWKAKTILIFNGNESESEGKVTIKGLDHYRNEFGNDQFQGAIVLSGDKGWRKFGENKQSLEGEGIANEKRSVYLIVTPVRLTPLKSKGFKVESAGEEKVNDKPAAKLKVTGPDGKDFTISFDKETGLPVKVVATVVGFNNMEYTQETTFDDYKDFDGIKKATKVELKRDGETFLKQTISDVKVLSDVAADAFAEPQ